MSLSDAYQTTQDLPDLVFGYLTPQAGDPSTSMLWADDLLKLDAYRPSAGQVEAARDAAAEFGFMVTATSEFGVAVAGSPELFERLTGTRMVSVEVLMPIQFGLLGNVTHLDLIDDGQPQALGVAEASNSNQIGYAILERPGTPKAISAEPPKVDKYYLKVPEDLVRILGAEKLHADGHFGAEVEIAMVDSGCYPHPYFTERGYTIVRSVVIPGLDPERDPIGHGTGVAANALALAPRATLHSYRASDAKGNMVALLAAFMQAKDSTAAIITNSWGYDLEYPAVGHVPIGRRPAVVEIQDALAKKAVIFASGNDSFSVEPQVPGVTSVGGIYYGVNKQLQASDYTASYDSPWFAGSSVPTVCGLVGQQPRAQYLMLPVQPNSELDREMALPELLSADPPDGTAKDDGWALFSGSSSAAPQVAGAAAVLMSALKVGPQDAIELLVENATSVPGNVGNARFGVRPEGASGRGLIDVGRAFDDSQNKRDGRGTSS